MSGESDRLKKKWDLLKALDEKHEIGRLRIRADIAECIRDCYNSGMKRTEVAELLDVVPSRVTALVQGNWRASAATIQRRPSNYRLAWVEPEVIERWIDKPTEEQVAARKDAECMYCSDKAEYVIQWENKEAYVCKFHKPPEVED